MLKRHVNFPGNTQRLAVILWQLGWLRFGLVPQSWLTYLSTDKAVGEVRLSPRRNAVRSKGGKVISTGSNNRKVGSGTSEKSLEKDDSMDLSGRYHRRFLLMLQTSWISEVRMIFHLWPRMKTGTNMDEPRSCCQNTFSKARLTARLYLGIRFKKYGRKCWASRLGSSKQCMFLNNYCGTSNDSN